MRDYRMCRHCAGLIVWSTSGSANRWMHVINGGKLPNLVQLFCPGAGSVAEPVTVVVCMFHSGTHMEQKSCADAHDVGPERSAAYWRAQSVKAGDDVEGCDDCSRDGHSCYVCGEPVSHGLRECESHGRA